MVIHADSYMIAYVCMIHCINIIIYAFCCYHLKEYDDDEQ